MSSNKGPELGSSGIERNKAENTKGRLQALKGELSRSKEVTPGERDVSWSSDYMGKYANKTSELIEDIRQTLGGLNKFTQGTSEGKYTIEYEDIMGDRKYILTAKLASGTISYSVPLDGGSRVITNHDSGKIVATVEKIMNPLGHP